MSESGKLFEINLLSCNMDIYNAIKTKEISESEMDAWLTAVENNQPLPLFNIKRYGEFFVTNIS